MKNYNEINIFKREHKQQNMQMEFWTTQKKFVQPIFTDAISLFLGFYSEFIQNSLYLKSEVRITIKLLF